jgi:MATE family multidrug resistance protein
MSLNNKISTHPTGSIREIANIALPLMLTNLSSNLMLFFDRLIIAQYSNAAMNAAITIGITCSIFHFGATAITSTAEIFVGRYFGAQKINRIGQPVWQMIWFSLFTFVMFIPLAMFAGNALVQQEYRTVGMPFYYWYMLCGPVFPLVMALTSFYIGRGKTRLITCTMVLGNIVNLILAYVLVLGVKNIIPAFGMQGAAIATIAAQLLQVNILLAIFLNKNNRKLYNTGNFYLQGKAFFDCLKIGVPMALGYMMELGSWAFLLRALTSSGTEYITVFAIGQSLFILFAFITEGMQKSVTVLAANYIGAKVMSAISAMLWSALKLQLIFAIIILIPLVFFADSVFKLFAVNVSPNTMPDLYQALRYALFWFWIFFFCDGVKWILAGVLLALEDAIAVVTLNFISIWLVAVLPIYYLVGKFKLSPFVALAFLVAYSIVNAMSLWLKYFRHQQQPQ